ncbi:hypothetical protein CF392_10820 [Tamilnaduibacter salinus]|uniref:Phosphoribosyltransferase domain-containing protein n=1 Tax=Tamilnaduibacter salinus TaxID=1484056 RepID=A0A2A2I360_9GAMM|nr:hypothetical protein [Tamilnaduibacter salinus]PAV25473.1 hypothetical protein CF392_10820 [Tamilnaduibacter salinus]
MRYRVVDLSDPDAFAAECQRLLNYALKCEQFDTLVGIATGGAWMVDSLRPDQSRYSIATVACKRPNTKHKNRGRHFMHALPRWLADLLRLFEAWYQECAFERRQYKGRDPISLRRQIKIESESEAAIRKAERILILDDAIDTGETMHCVRLYLSELNPRVTLKTAVMTQTMKNPVAQPDFCLYRDALIRFPWSNDA